MFNKSKQLENARNRIADLTDEVDRLMRQSRDEERDHEMELEAVEERYTKTIRQLNKKYDELSERTHGHEEELRTLTTEKKTAEKLARDARTELRKVQDELLETKTKVKMEQELMEHNLKILMESNGIELQKKELVMKEETSAKVTAAKEDAANKVAAVKEEFNNKLTAALVERSQANAATMEAILDRLPKVNVNAMLGGGQIPEKANDK